MLVILKPKSLIIGTLSMGLHACEG